MDGRNLGAEPALSLAQLEAQITELAGHLNAANYRWLKLIAEFDRREGWVGRQLISCAHWLNFKCGLNLGAAREKVRVAHALERLPQIAAAMGRGELSYSKVRALTRVAEAGTEPYFLSIALHGTAHHVEKLVRCYRRAQEAEELSHEAQQQAKRELEYWFDTDGALVIKGRLPALAGAMVIKALEAAMDSAPRPQRRADTEEEGPPQELPLSWGARRADALAVVAESYLQRAARSCSTADRHQIVVHVDAETLRERAAGRCEIEGGPTLPVETVRRLSCDASLVRIMENESGAPLDVGRKTRSIPPAIRRALAARDRGCRFPGCTHQRYLDAHHIRHWAEGGATKVSNLLTLCRFHHRLVHEGGICVETLPDGGWRFSSPDGRAYESPGQGQNAWHAWSDLQHTHAQRGIHIDADTAATRWCGERMDYGLAIQMLLQYAGPPRKRSRGNVQADAAASGRNALRFVS